VGHGRLGVVCASELDDAEQQENQHRQHERELDHRCSAARIPVMKPHVIDSRRPPPVHASALLTKSHGAKGAARTTPLVAGGSFGTLLLVSGKRR
jgi:hypothetical protein